MNFIIIILHSLSLSLSQTHPPYYKEMNEHSYHEYFVALGMHGLTWTNSQRE